MRETFKEKWSRYETKIVLIVSFLLVAVIAFQAGFLQGRKNHGDSIIIEKTAEAGAEKTATSPPEAQNLPQTSGKEQPGVNVQKAECVFVGSKNSNKYHLPTCRWAKNIKPENVVCFSSADEAKLKGYLPDGNCIK